jgi:hypothetical protein
LRKLPRVLTCYFVRNACKPAMNSVRSSKWRVICAVTAKSSSFANPAAIVSAHRPGIDFQFREKSASSTFTN